MSDDDLKETEEADSTDPFSSSVFGVPGDDATTGRLLPSGAAAPERIGPYRFIERLGEGGMGVVFLAEQEQPIRRQVAVKLIRGGADSQEVLARFESERQALALMNHSNIAKVYEAGSTPDGMPYFVMEYVENGMPLDHFARTKRLSIEARLALFIEICDAIQHAHQKGVVHRDIKPSNILVSPKNGSGTAKIIDFGIAKALDQRTLEHSFYTQTGNIIGTPAYMSPEQTDLLGANVDTRTDVYSLGCVLYELLVGSLPVDAETLRRGDLVAIFMKIREKDPEKPSTRLKSRADPLRLTKAAEERRTTIRALHRRLQGDLDWITLKALEKDPARRYASVSEFSNDIERHLASQPVFARPPSLGYVVAKFLRRYRWQVSAATAFVLVLLGIVLGQLGVRIGNSREQLDLGREAWSRFLNARASETELRERWNKQRAAFEFWQPPWERAEELAARRELKSLYEGIQTHRTAAQRHFELAKDLAPWFTSEDEAARQSLAEINYQLREKALFEGAVEVPPSHFASEVRRQGIPSYDERLRKGGEISLSSEPPGATVYCFRYENTEYGSNIDEHLVPLPYDPEAGLDDPRTGLLDGPFLELARVTSDQAVFKPGDRLVKASQKSADASAHAISTRADLAGFLETVGTDESVRVQVLRNGELTDLDWTPYPDRPRDSEVTRALFKAGRMVDPHRQFGVSFAGYPLAFHPDSRVGVIDAGASLDVTLPGGSYLFILRKDGHLDTRVPVTIPTQDEIPTVRLFRPDEVPEGFVHVPAGDFSLGGDREAYKPLDRESRHVASFFMQRREVTFGEYLAFVNDPETLARREDGSGKVKPLADWNRSPELRRLSAGEHFVDLIPRAGRVDLLLPDRDGRYRLNETQVPRADLPALGVPALAALEYAEWLTRKHSGRWRFRLPDDFEWEKAARGVDRRAHVWGNYPLYLFCESHLGKLPRPAESGVSPVGQHPMDESVYGVLDLAGSAKEPVITEAHPRIERFCTLRGGSWDSTDERDFHVATRNRRLAHLAQRFVGIRLVAEVAAAK